MDEVEEPISQYGNDSAFLLDWSVTNKYLYIVSSQPQEVPNALF